MTRAERKAQLEATGKYTAAEIEAILDQEYGGGQTNDGEPGDDSDPKGGGGHP